MEVYKIIANLNVLAWFILPIRQYNTRFFLFFFILALFDPLALLSFYIVKVSTQYVFSAGTTILLYVALFDVKKKYRILFFAFSVLMYAVSVFVFRFNEISIHIVIHFVILIQFLKLLMKKYSETRTLLWFQIILIIYEVSLLLKFFILITESQIGPVYFYTTTLIQIFIGIFFLFVNEKNSPAIKF